ncbi:MAG: hypothetical protein PHI34_03845 [Acidobacteriota bacterium]|nr:hypothetical protein [Acidobacteriota bacterium]
MKAVKPAILISALFAVLVVTPAGLPAQSAAPQLYLRGDFLVDVSRAGEYEAAVKDLLAELAKHGFPFRIDVYGTDDGHYYADVPLKSHADVDSVLAAWEELGRKMGLPNQRALLDRISACEVERVFQFWTYRPDISFLPEKERLKSGEIDYYTWDYVWIVPGKEAEFEACNKEWIVLSKAKAARDPFFTYAGGLGVKVPVYVWVEYGKSAADYAATEDEFWNSMGEEGAALSKRTRAVIRTRESKTGRRRADLSFAPTRGQV